MIKCSSFFCCPNFVQLLKIAQNPHRSYCCHAACSALCCISIFLMTVSEIVMTNREDAPASGNIPYRESFMKSQVLSDKVQDFYDEKFWEDYNIIEPTESLEYAVKRLKKAND